MFGYGEIFLKAEEKTVTSSNLDLWTQQLSDKNVAAGDTCLLISGAGAPAIWSSILRAHKAYNSL